MKRSITLKKEYGDDALHNVFELVKSEAEAPPKLNIGAFVADASETVCIVLEDGMDDNFAKIISEAKKARVYALVPEIDESEYVKLRGKAIIREVPYIKGNYCLIDDKVLLIFDEEMYGTVINSQDAISTVKRIFEREFWENAKEEYIEAKHPCAERTFDVPPIYSSDDVIIDDGFGETTALKQMILRAKTVAYTKKVPAGADHNIILNKITDNSDFLKAYRGENIFYYRNLPFCFFISSDDVTYAVNFDIAEYDKLPERGKGRFFAVKISGELFGERYKFNKHKTIGELVGQTVIDADGSPIEIKDCVKEARTVSVDLRLARELERMEADPEALEARLDKKDADLLTTSHTAKQVIFNIELKIQPKNISKKADAYTQFENAQKAYDKKKKELGAFIDGSKDKAIKKSFSALTADAFSTVKDYMRAVEELNSLIDEINNDDSLGEVLGGKKTPKAIQKLAAESISMDIPKFGELYQQKNKYEYVLKHSSDLDAAMDEMQKAGIEQANVAYLEEK